MLKETEIKEIREHLMKAQNPLFYFDNDQDGLSSYLLLRRFFNKGNPVPVKTSPLDMEYFRRIDEFNPDYVFILDQPTVDNKFFEALQERNIPIVWIDHHENDLELIPSFVNYYNPIYSSGTNEPVTDLCYRIANKKEDLWLLIAGCISDKYFPEEYSDFLKKYPDLGIDSDKPFEILYNSEIGKIARMMGIGLKDRTSLVMKMIRFLVNARTPYEVFEEKIENHSMHKRFNEIDSKLQKLLLRAREKDDGKIIFFRYASETSMSADLANKLSYDFPGRVIVVAYDKGVKVNLSIRGKNIREKVLEVVKDISGARAGGHADAVGAQMSVEDLDSFEEKLREILNQNN